MTSQFESGFGLPSADITLTEVETAPLAVLSEEERAGGAVVGILATDLPGDRTTTAKVYHGTPVAGEIETVGDTDWFKVFLTEGQDYKFTVTGSSDGFNTLYDPSLSLYGESGPYLDYDDDTNGRDPQISWTATETGWHYLEAHAFGSYTGTYDIEVTASDARADIRPMNLTLGDTEWHDGEEITVTWDLINEGTATASGFRSALYLSTNSFISTADLTVSVDSAPGTMRPGDVNMEHDQLTFTFDGLGLASGTYWVGVIADDFGAIGELDESNNKTAAIQVTIIGDDYGETIADAGSMTVGSTLSGELEAYGDYDRIAVQLTAGVGYTFEMRAAGADPLTDPYLTLRDDLGDYITQNDDSLYDEGNASSIYLIAGRTGTYYLDAGTVFNDTGTYELEVYEEPRADLIADNLVLHSGATLVSGEEVEVTWDITNQGAANASGFSSGLFLSTNSTITTFDTLLTRDDLPGTILPGITNPEHDQRTFTLDTVGLASGTYWVGVLADFDQDLREENESNNASAPIQVTLISDDHYDDTRATSVLASGYTTGEIERGADEDWFKLDVIEGGIYTINMLAAGAFAGTLANSFLAVWDSSGSYMKYWDDNGGTNYDSLVQFTATATETLWVAASSQGTITGSYTLHLDANEGPDLEAKYVSAPSTLTDGGLYTVYWNLENNGPLDAGASQSGIYLSTDSNINTFDLLLGTVSQSAVAAGDWDAGSLIAQFDGLGLASGTYWIGVVANHDYALSEQDWNNNASAAVQVQVIGDDHDEGVGTTSVLPTTGALVLGDIEQELDTDWFAVDLNAGDTYTFDVLGGWQVSGLLPNSILRLHDASGAEIVQNVDVPFEDAKLVYRAETSGVHYLEVAPDAGATGGYYVEARATPMPDHAALHLELDRTLWRDDMTMTGLFEAENLGDDWANGYTVDFYLSSNSIITTSDDLIATEPFTYTLPQGGWTRQSYDIPVAGLSPGTYWFGGIITPPAGTVEYDRRNDAFAPIQITIVDDDWEDRYWLTDVGVMDGTVTGEIEIDHDVDSVAYRLTAGKTYVFDLKGADGGGGTLADPLLFLLDGGGAVLASDDDGGTGSDSRITFYSEYTQSITADVHSGDGGLGTWELTVEEHEVDLAVSGLAPANLVWEIGTDQTVSWAVSNLGSLEEFGINSALYLSSNPTITTTDDQLGLDYYGLPLASGATGEVTLNLHGWGDSLAPGTYWIGAIVDYQGTRAETNETNNVTAAIQIEIVEDDHADDPFAAAEALAGDLVQGDVETPVDEDWFRVELRGGRAYELLGQTDGDGAGTATFEIRDLSGNVYAAATSPGAGGAGTAMFTAPTDGDYFVRVRGDGAVSPGGYDFQVRHAAEDLTPGRPILETGQLSLGTNWTSITFSNTYVDPVLVAYVNSINGAQAVTVRVADLSSGSARLYLQEPDSYDGGHAAETVSWVVMEAGTWRLADGTLVQAGSVSTAMVAEAGFVDVSLSGAFDSTPALMSQVMSDNGPSYVNTRVRDLTEDGFGITMQEEEGGAPGHATEDLGWIAWETGAGVTGGMTWEAGASPSTHGGSHTALHHLAPTGADTLVASLQSFTGADPAHARGLGDDGAGFSTFVEEDVSADGELGHSLEYIGWVATAGASQAGGHAVADVLEVGTAQLNHLETRVHFENDYVDPVVIAFVATANGAAPVAVRISSVDGDGAVLRLQEDSTGDGFHALEEVNWMVVERGTWMLTDGTVVQAGVVDTGKLTTQGTETVAYDAAFDDRPAVFAQVQTTHGIDFVTTRIDNSGASGFELAMQEEEKLNWSGHAVEQVGWVAIETGAGAGDDFEFEAAAGVSASSTPAALGLGALDAAGTEALVQLSTLNGIDPAWARGHGDGAGGPLAALEEDQTLDAETFHAAEQFDWFAFDQAGSASGISIHETVLVI